MSTAAKPIAETLRHLRRLQAEPLRIKIEMTLARIRAWIEYWEREGYEVHVAFSGGKDSTVLLHLVRLVAPKTVAVFVDTGLEYREIVEFVASTPNVVVVRPKMSFLQVTRKYGFPVISKTVAQYVAQMRRCPKDSKTYILRDTGFTSTGKYSQRLKLPDKWRFLLDAPFEISAVCCDILKKEPLFRYERGHHSVPFVGEMACDSRNRESEYLRAGQCNVVKAKHPKSIPMAFWLEDDVWSYIRQNNLPYSSIYDKGATRTGCKQCMFGIHLEGQPNRLQRMHADDPKGWKYCMDVVGCRQVMQYIGVPYEHEQTIFEAAQSSAT